MLLIDHIIWINIATKLNFYNFDELECRDGYTYRIEHNRTKTVTYSDLQLGEDKNLFVFQKTNLSCLLHELLHSIPDQRCIVKRYENKGVIDENLSKELTQTLKQFKCKHAIGIVINKTNPIIDLFFDSVFMYNSFVQFIFSESQIIISHSDHMDIFISSKKDRLQDIQKILSKEEMNQSIVTYIE